MNSLNILSARVIGQATPPPSPAKGRQSRAFSENLRSQDLPPPSSRAAKRSSSEHEGDRKLAAEREKSLLGSEDEIEHEPGQEPKPDDGDGDDDEKTPLIDKLQADAVSSTKQSRLRLAVQRFVDALAYSIKSVLSTLTRPGVYIVQCFYDEQGLFSPLLPLRRLRKRRPRPNGTASTANAIGLSGSAEPAELEARATSEKPRPKSKRPAPSRAPSKKEKGPGSSSSPTSESELEQQAHHQSSAEADDSTPNRRSIRIKLKNEDSIRLRKQKKAREPKGSSSATSNPSAVTAANLKSPTSPAASLRLTKYPRAPAPPHPLVPRRQPSYTNLNPFPPHLPQKTLVIDLDETLIHSLSKGGRMSSGHMVEVKLNTTIPLSSGNNGAPAVLGPQHPILYYVHKRPHCDDFLRKVCKWYNLVVFTASVQEYADPVIDWLELERKYFSARFYRQHCTFRNGAYIKDLSSVEPDLSRVMILDNSPLSYIFHEDNAIPIEGWINDPTDNDLLHLIPMLEALQYVTDVRALLALRRGEVDAAH